MANNPKGQPSPAGSNDGNVSVVLHVTPQQKAALGRWADDEQRSMSAQARILLEEAIPVKYFQEA